MSTRSTARRAFTLIEAIAAIVILSLISAIIVPVIFSAGDAYANSASTRRTAEKGAYAMERVVRLLRDTPASATRGKVDVTIANPSQVRFGDGHGVELTGTTLSLRDTSGALSTLCDNVSNFTIAYIGNDGTSNTAGTPANTQRYNITIVTDGFELRSSALARIRVIDP
jgi:prepilin-type N-terminal cleavage/methylation domain-containing protein